MEKYKVLITFLIISFLENGDKEPLLKGLEYVEAKLVEENPDVDNGGLWLRFFKGDTLATTIRNVRSDIHPSQNNHTHLLECFEAVRDLDQLEVHFS